MITNVLLVEDDPEDLMILKEMIQTLLPEIECYLAKNGIEALHICRSLSVDLVISDINMPVMDGKELVTIIRKEISRHLPVILVSTSKWEEAEVLSLGATYFFVKGYSFQESLNKLEYALSVYAK
ncbi:Response regulator receiver domain-containing protein [Filimonas lacunae]|uniref:Response regulator receiver domain-containing protein n=2 Tax=Filimonas lacunae TaxID=477680 RepID=A0A173MH00_9BACT|nr:DNA-binding response regulator, AraC family [Filimonas lacunae]SIT27936.1 Response regulator receiver domain-containing protein [Filimonas lacunae]